MNAQSQLTQHKCGLTKKQREIIDFIESFITSHGYSPSYREIMKHFGFTSTATISKYVATLQRKGFLKMEKKSSRSLSLNHNAHLPLSKDQAKLPLIGQLSEGLPLETFSKFEEVEVPSSFSFQPENSYVLKIKDGSFQEERMAPGDLIIVEAKQSAEIGSLILANINKMETLIKYYYPEGNYIKLESCNPNLQAIIVRDDSFSIQGAVVGLLRNFKTL